VQDSRIIARAIIRPTQALTPRVEGNQLSVTARVPANTHATVYLPGARLEQVREGLSA
jgi:hypothetical protein